MLRAAVSRREVAEPDLESPAPGYDPIWTSLLAARPDLLYETYCTATAGMLLLAYSGYYTAMISSFVTRSLLLHRCCGRIIGLRLPRLFVHVLCEAVAGLDELDTVSERVHRVEATHMR